MNSTHDVFHSILHITHNDSDAIGCALIEELLYPKEVMEYKNLVVVEAGASYADKVIITELLGLELSFMKSIKEFYESKDLESKKFLFIRELIETHFSEGKLKYDFLLISDHNISEEMAYFLDYLKRDLLVYMDQSTNPITFDLMLFDHHDSARDLEKYSWVYMPPYVLNEGFRNVSACHLMYTKMNMIGKYSPITLHSASMMVNVSDVNQMGLSMSEMQSLWKVILLISYYDTFSYKEEKELYEKMLSDNFPIGTNYSADYVSNALEIYEFQKVLDDLVSWYKENIRYINHSDSFPSIERDMKHSFSDGKIFPPDIEFINEKVVKEIKFKNYLDIYRKARVIKFVFEGFLYDCVVFISCRGDYVSEEMYELIHSNEKIHMGIIIFPESMEISLRSDGTVNVSEIAVSLGGGGHVKASGFHANKETIMFLMATYYSGEFLWKYNQNN